MKGGFFVSEINNDPVHVTGDERRHPAIRQLARACIALARLRLEQEARADAADPGAVSVASSGDSADEEGALHG
jgi:hypothetical protein